MAFRSIRKCFAAFGGGESAPVAVDPENWAIFKGRHGAVDARFAQQVQGRIRRAVGVVVDVVGVAVGELVARMQAGDLDDAVEFQAADRCIGCGEEKWKSRKSPMTAGWISSMVSSVSGSAAAIRVWRQRLSSGSQIVDSRSMYSGCGAASRSRNPAPFACRCAFPRPALERPSSNTRAAALEIFRLQCRDQPTHAHGQQYRGDLGGAAGQVALCPFAGKGEDRHGHRHPAQ